MELEFWFQNNFMLISTLNKIDWDYIFLFKILFS